MSTYDEGFDDGEESNQDEWELALKEVLPSSMEEEILPTTVADYIRQLREGKMR